MCLFRRMQKKRKLNLNWYLKRNCGPFWENWVCVTLIRQLIVVELLATRRCLARGFVLRKWVKKGIHFSVYQSSFGTHHGVIKIIMKNRRVLVRLQRKQEAKLPRTKERRMNKKKGLREWNRPSDFCLASKNSRV